MTTTSKRSLSSVPLRHRLGVTLHPRGPGLTHQALKWPLSTIEQQLNNHYQHNYWMIMTDTCFNHSEPILHDMQRHSQSDILDLVVTAFQGYKPVTCFWPGLLGLSILWLESSPLWELQKGGPTTRAANAVRTRKQFIGWPVFLAAAVCSQVSGIALCSMAGH